MDHSELGEPLNGIRYKFLESHEHDEAIKLLERSLYRIALEPFTYDPASAEDWNAFFTKIIKSGKNLSYIAVDEETGEIAGCRIVDLVQRDAPSDLKSSYPPYFKHKNSIDVFKLCGDVCKDVNLFEQYGISEYPEMFGLTVDPKYRMRGIAGELYQRGLNYFQKKGFPIVKCSFTSPYTRRAGIKRGYKEFARRNFHDCKDDQGKVLNPDSNPEEFLSYGIFDLRNRKIE
jgi:ribosomal protein S18 acetylase RimI-like enzyme